MAKIALKVNDVIMGYYISDDSDFTTDVARAFVYASTDEARTDVVQIEAQWELPEGGSLVVID